MDNTLQDIIFEYKKSEIQSEEEIRTKLIIPLLDYLGYKSYLRAENFPVYGYEGRNKLPTKEADFILFSDKDFANHRKCNQPDTDWVYKNSLLVVEAKKPGEMPEIMGQPIFYTVWTKAVAYIAIDGVTIRGFLYNSINADPEIVNCKIEDLPDNNAFWKFSFENILRIKENSAYALDEITGGNYKDITVVTSDAQEELKIVDAYSANALTEEDLKDFPEATLQYMREALGKNSLGLNKVQLITRYLNTTDALLQNDLRYDVPEYIFSFPRKEYQASLFINNVVMPIDRGKVTEYYWNEYDRFFYESQYIQADIVYKNNVLLNYELGFHVLDNTVTQRLKSFENVERILYAGEIKIAINGNNNCSLHLSAEYEDHMWASRNLVLSQMDMWRQEMEKMREIEEFYNVNFQLKTVIGKDKINELYGAVDFVHAGIALQENCDITLPGGIFNEDISIDEPVILEDNKEIPLPKRTIHNVNFAPYQSWLLPCTINFEDTKQSDTIKVPGCVRYKIDPLAE